MSVLDADADVNIGGRQTQANINICINIGIDIEREMRCRCRGRCWLSYRHRCGSRQRYVPEETLMLSRSVHRYAGPTERANLEDDSLDLPLPGPPFKDSASFS